ncbi:MAG TPA: hypothetical protein VGL87_13670 [Steroidobacteraceae bacterium]|jgi:hypothetical protein
MAVRKHTTKNLIPASSASSPPSKPAGRRRQRKAKRRSSARVDEMPVPERLHQAIESERGNLFKADSLLGCLVIAMEYEADAVSGPHYPDVAQIARELVQKSIDGLDSLTLQRVLRDKVKEEFCVISVGPTPMTHELPTFQWRDSSQVRAARSRKAHTLRLHRRNYLRVRAA